MECFALDASHTHPKQNHTAKRIYDRLVDELDFTASYTTVRRLVNELSNKSKEPFIPLEFNIGEEHKLILDLLVFISIMNKLKLSPSVHASVIVLNTLLKPNILNKSCRNDSVRRNAMVPMPHVASVASVA